MQWKLSEIVSKNGKNAEKGLLNSKNVIVKRNKYVELDDFNKYIYW